MATPFQQLNFKPAGFQQNGVNAATGFTGNAVSGGGGGGGGVGGVSTGGLAANSPIAQWMVSQGLDPTLRDPSQDTSLAKLFGGLTGQQQLAMIDSGQGGAGLYDSLVQGGYNQDQLGGFQTMGNYDTGFGQDAGNLASIGAPGSTPGFVTPSFGGTSGTAANNPTTPLPGSAAAQSNQNGLYGLAPPPTQPGTTTPAAGTEGVNAAGQRVFTPAAGTAPAAGTEGVNAAGQRVFTPASGTTPAAGPNTLATQRTFDPTTGAIGVTGGTSTPPTSPGVATPPSTLPGTPVAANPAAGLGAASLASLAAGTTPSINGGNSIPLPSSSSGYALDPSAYMNPEEQYLQQWMTNDTQSAYGAAGDELSGADQRALSSNQANLAAATSYAPALAAAEQQQGAGIGLGEFNQNFGYNQALNNEEIPFSQNLQLAQLGLGGTEAGVQEQEMLAQIEAQLAQSAGTASAAGTTGIGSTASNSIQQMINQIMQQSNLASLYQAYGITPPGSTT